MQPFQDIPTDDKDVCSEKIHTAENDNVKQNGGAIILWRGRTGHKYFSNAPFQDNPMCAENVEMAKIVEKEGIKGDNELKWSSWKAETSDWILLG